MTPLAALRQRAGAKLQVEAFRIGDAKTGFFVIEKKFVDDLRASGDDAVEKHYREVLSSLGVTEEALGDVGVTPLGVAKATREEPASLWHDATATAHRIW